MDYRLPFVLALFCMNSAFADFSTASFKTHPIEPAAHLGPYIIEVTGEWPSDCHPGEQKPVIREFTGETLLVEFETIIEHVTCNDVTTPYRVLIDMSDVIEGGTTNPTGIDVTLRFGESEHMEPVSLLCICSPAPVGPDIKPEPGLYEGGGLDKQGILLARQKDRMGIYPLVYDETGNSQWLFGGGGIVEDVYFVKLKELSGGQCLGCLPPNDPPQKEVVGKLTVLMDSQGAIQVKVDDGLFEEYQPVEFGYGAYKVYNHDENMSHWIPDLNGRWALVDDNSDLWEEASPLPSDVLPLVFDIEEGIVRDPPPPVVAPPPPSIVEYSILDIKGEVVAEMACGFVGEMLCDLYSPSLDEPLHWFRVGAISIERILMTNLQELGSQERIGIGEGTAVRID
jgi:hypothetical protein